MATCTCRSVAQVGLGSRTGMATCICCTLVGLWQTGVARSGEPSVAWLVTGAARMPRQLVVGMVPHVPAGTC